jgi:nitric oxide reductase subunit C
VTSPPDRFSFTRGQVLLLLLGCFLSLTVVAYSDYPREGSRPMAPEARRGLEVWRSNNCQVCHQIHGFGGFHGPDLTNRLTEDVLDAELIQVILTGQGRMPAFELPDEELDALMTWLRWINDSGRAQPEPLQAASSPIASMHFNELITLAGERELVTITGSAQEGLELWTTMQCGTCHRAFQAGLLREPDLTAAATDRSFESLSRILAQGSGRMPATPLDDNQVRTLGAFLQWVADHRSDLSELNLELTQHEPFRWSDLPWFEYR